MGFADDAATGSMVMPPLLTELDTGTSGKDVPSGWRRTKSRKRIGLASERVDAAASRSERVENRMFPSFSVLVGMYGVD